MLDTKINYPKCEQCKKRNSPLCLIGDFENPVNYTLVCDNCYRDLSWLENTSWKIASDADNVVIWRRS